MKNKPLYYQRKDEEEDEEFGYHYDEDKQAELGKKSSMADPKTRPVAPDKVWFFSLNTVFLVT